MIYELIYETELEKILSQAKELEEKLSRMSEDSNADPIILNQLRLEMIEIS